MRKQVIGKVISDKMQKTRVVVSEKRVMHLLYKKYIKRKIKHYVHDEREESKVGDTVLIEETRPISKLKRWRLIKVIK